MEPLTVESIQLSTGQTVDLPLIMEATMLGAVYGVPREAVEALLPEGIRPIRATPGGEAAVTLLSVEYHGVSVGGIDPYNEFGVIIPATHEQTRDIPYVTALYRATSGYVWFLPVTTEPAKALGVDVWGYPKAVADITHRDKGSWRRTTVTIDGERFITMDVDRPPSLPMQDDGYSYTDNDGDLLRVPIEINAEIGGWPFTSNASVSIGEHHRAEPLRELDIGGRALARISLTGESRFYPGEPL